HRACSKRSITVITVLRGVFEIIRAEVDASELGPAVMQWMLTAVAPLDGQVHIQVGTLPGGYYVDHTGFGTRKFPDKNTAWDAIKELMRRHRGEWREVPCDRAPFVALRRPDGSRVIYDINGDCLHEHWGEFKDTL